MLSNQMRSLYRKWMSLGLLFATFVILGTSRAVSHVSATAPCYQDCEENLASCIDECPTPCAADSSESNCASCISDCNTTFSSCMNVAVSCPNDPPADPGRCSVYGGLICPIVNGVPNCSQPPAQYGYYLICSTGGGTCVACPGLSYCTGSGGQPPCF